MTTIFPHCLPFYLSLMDFARDGKISEEEFMRATGHYRRLGKLLTINTWQSIRKGRLHTFLFSPNYLSIPLLWKDI